MMARLEEKYLECSECKLCEVVNRREENREIENTFLDQTDHFIWVPGLGSFVEGYSLVISKNHVLNTGCFDTQVIQELDLFIQKIRRKLRNIYKSDSILFEHGSMGRHDYAGSCIEHHHLHILPVDLPSVLEFLSQKFARRHPISSLEDLTHFNQDRIPYIYYASASQAQYVFEVPVLPRQYLRRVIAAERGRPQDWDWREKPFMENIKAFVIKMKKLRRDK